MAELRIFSYLPNPRVWKALIAADLCKIDVEVTGDKPANLANWLWDYDARPLTDAERSPDSPFARQGKRGFRTTLYKTDTFLEKQPFATVPCAFAGQGAVGLFESNSILRAVARAGGSHLYGNGNLSLASRIDSFLDAGLVFAREAQVYLLEMDAPSAVTHARMAAAYDFYFDGLEQALSVNRFLAADELTIADISFVCDVAQFLREGHYREKLISAGLVVISDDFGQRYPRTQAHMLTLAARADFSKHLGTYLDWYKRAIAKA